MVITVDELRLSDDIVLPIDAVTETFAFIAKRRVGKSNAAVVMAEQMYFAGIPWVCIDPKGDWWGIRSSADGNGEGLSVTVFGGKHGDRPLHPDAGAFMAELIVRLRLTCILDVSEFSQAEKIRFLLAFATRLLQVNEEPVHLFFEECDDYIPQNLIGKSGGDEDETKLVRAFSRLIRHGGFKGIGASLITQRAALVSKNVLAQVDTFIALRTTEPLDIKVVNDRLRGHPRQKEIADSLPSLQAGDAWIISPAFLEVYVRTTFYRRSTFDSGRTPKIGEKRVVPTKLADVELDEITAAMAEIIEKAEATDPDKLASKLTAQAEKIAQLESFVAEQNATLTEMGEWIAEYRENPPEVEVEVIVERIPAAIREAVVGLASSVGDLCFRATEAAADVEASVTSASSLLDALDAAEVAETRAPAPPPRPVPTVRPGRTDPPTIPKLPARVPTVLPPAPPGTDATDVRLKAGARRMLETLARQFPMQLNRRQLGTLAKVAARGGTFGDYLSVLRTHGLIIEPEGARGPVLITEAGFAFLGTQPAAPLTTKEIVAMYQERLKAGARRMLDELVNAWPDGLSREELGEKAVVTVSGGTFGDYLSVLRTNGLAVEPAGPGGLVYADASTLQLA